MKNHGHVLNLRLRQAVLPNDDKWRDAILTVIQQNDPVLCWFNNQCFGASRKTRANVHSIRIHRFTRVEIKVFEIGSDVLGVVVLYPGLERFYFRIIGALLLELCNDFFEVCWWTNGFGISACFSGKKGFRGGTEALPFNWV